MILLARIAVAWMLGVAVFLGAFPATADTKQVAVYLEGAKADHYRDLVVEAVPQGLDVVEERAFAVALRRAGLRGPMGYAISSRGARRMLLKVIRRALGKSEAEAAVIGRVAMGRGGLTMTTMVVTPDDELLYDDAITLSGDTGAQAQAIAEALIPPLSELAPPPEPEPEPDAEEVKEEEEENEEEEDEEEEEEEPSDFRSNRPGAELFRLGLGVEIGGRFFDYPESIANTNNLRPFSIFGAPGIFVSGAIYPAATLDIPVLSDLGLQAEYMHAFGLSSETADGRYVFDASYNRFLAGLRYRYRIDDEADFPLVIGASFNAGFLNFTFTPEPGSEEIAGEVATAEYLFLQPEIDARLPLADFFALVPSFGYLAVLEGGEVYDRFTSATVHGIDAGLTLAFPVTAGFEASAGANYVRYFSSFDPQVGDAYVAGGALDQFVMLRAGAAYVY